MIWLCTTCGVIQTSIAASMPNINLYGMAFKYISIGLGPIVYLDNTRGRMICSGTNGTAISPSFSFGIPDSTSFKLNTESVAEKPI